MPPSPPSCESILGRISASLDEGVPLTPEDQAHVRNCPECSRFLDLWTGEIPHTLLAPPPVADPELRRRILAIPSASPPAPSQTVIRGWPRLPALVPAAAAVLALAAVTWLIVDIHPAPAPLVKQTPASLAEQELAALKEDFRQGLLAIRGPVESVHLELSR